MIKNISNVHARQAEIVRLGKEGRTTLNEVAEAWKCSTENVACYLHRLQEEYKYAYLIDGKGCFRIFQEIE